LILERSFATCAPVPLKIAPLFRQRPPNNPRGPGCVNRANFAPKPNPNCHSIQPTLWPCVACDLTSFAVFVCMFVLVLLLFDLVCVCGTCSPPRSNRTHARRHTLRRRAALLAWI